VKHSLKHYHNVILHFIVLCARQISRQTLKFYLQWNGHVYSRELQNWQASSEHIMPSYSRTAFTLGPHNRPESDHCAGARERPNERVAKKGVIQLVIRPPLTDEMISECPKLASASCDNWMVMYAPNAYTANARADADLPCVFPLVKGLNACKCPHSWLVWSHHGGTYSDTHGDSRRQRFSIDDYTSFRRRELNRCHRHAIQSSLCCEWF